MYFTPSLVQICMYSANFTTVGMWNLAILTSDHCMKYQTPRLKLVLDDLYTCTSIHKLVFLIFTWNLTLTMHIRVRIIKCTIQSFMIIKVFINVKHSHATHIRMEYVVGRFRSCDLYIDHVTSWYNILLKEQQ